MEMSMRANEDIEIGEDLTPPLSPLAFSLHHHFLHSHCSTCFSPLSSTTAASVPPLHCSPLCASFDASLPSTSSSSDLRVALRLLHSVPPSPHLHRLSDLLTNRHKLTSDPDIVALLRETRINGNVNGEEDTDLLEAALCLVLTNAVEVRDDGGRSLGIAVYGTSFSWINHSCSPNASYRFVISKPNMMSFPESKLRIVPCSSEGESDAFGIIDSAKGCDGYGPKVIIRSIRRIKKGEEITVAYTDLLQPKDIRQSELWSKYRFVCSCTRCNSSPPCYVDHALQEISLSNLDSSSAVSDAGLLREKFSDNFTDYVDEIITKYLSDGDPRYCCNKLESMLIHGLIDEQVETNDGKSKLNIRLHPLHHVALNAYTTMASAYKVCANDLLVLYPESEVGHHMEVLNMSRNSAAYSLFLAAATYHLYRFEPSLLASVANFWVSAGESLLSLVRSFSWSSLEKWKLSVPDLSSFVEKNFSKCWCLDKYEIFSSPNKVLSTDFESISSELQNCITGFSQKVWRFLIQHCLYLKMFKDFKFRGLGKSSTIWDLEASLVGNHIDFSYTNDNVDLETKEYRDELWMDIFQLGVHCLIFGGISARVCFGQNFHWISHIQRILTP